MFFYFIGFVIVDGRATYDSSLGPVICCYSVNVVALYVILLKPPFFDKLFQIMPSEFVNFIFARIFFVISIKNWHIYMQEAMWITLCCSSSFFK